MSWRDQKRSFEDELNDYAHKVTGKPAKQNTLTQEEMDELFN